MCQFASSRFTVPQRTFANTHKLIICMHWAIKHFKCYVQYVHFIVMLGDAAFPLFVKRKDLLPYIIAVLLDLDSF